MCGVSFAPMRDNEGSKPLSEQWIYMERWLRKVSSARRSRWRNEVRSDVFLWGWLCDLQFLALRKVSTGRCIGNGFLWFSALAGGHFFDDCIHNDIGPGRKALCEMRKILIFPTICVPGVFFVPVGPWHQQRSRSTWFKKRLLVDVRGWKNKAIVEMNFVMRIGE